MDNNLNQRSLRRISSYNNIDIEDLEDINQYFNINDNNNNNLQFIETQVNLRYLSNLVRLRQYINREQLNTNKNSNKFSLHEIINVFFTKEFFIFITAILLISAFVIFYYLVKILKNIFECNSLQCFFDKIYLSNVYYFNKLEKDVDIDNILIIVYIFIVSLTWYIFLLVNFILFNYIEYKLIKNSIYISSIIMISPILYLSQYLMLSSNYKKNMYEYSFNKYTENKNNYKEYQNIDNYIYTFYKINNFDNLGTSFNNYNMKKFINPNGSLHYSINNSLDFYIILTISTLLFSINIFQVYFYNLYNYKFVLKSKDNINNNKNIYETINSKKGIINYIYIHYSLLKLNKISSISSLLLYMKEKFVEFNTKEDIDSFKKILIYTKCEYIIRLIILINSLISLVVIYIIINLINYSTEIYKYNNNHNQILTIRYIFILKLIHTFYKTICRELILYSSSKKYSHLFYEKTINNVRIINFFLKLIYDIFDLIICLFLIVISFYKKMYLHSFIYFSLFVSFLFYILRFFYLRNYYCKQFNKLNSNFTLIYNKNEKEVCSICHEKLKYRRTINRCGHSFHL